MCCLVVSRRNIFNYVIIVVFMYNVFIWLFGKLFIEIFFNVFNFLIIDVSKVDEVSSYFVGWIVMVRFFM